MNNTKLPSIVKCYICDITMSSAQHLKLHFSKVHFESQNRAKEGEEEEVKNKYKLIEETSVGTIGTTDVHFGHNITFGTPEQLDKQFNGLVWTQSCDKGVDIAFTERNRTRDKAQLDGILRFEGMAHKKKSRTLKVDTNFNVIYGALRLETEINSPEIILTGDQFKVNSNTHYSVHNMCYTRAYLSFNIFKE